MTPTIQTDPPWWRHAQWLEGQDRLAEAEAVIHEGCPYVGFALSTAELYRQRTRRLRQHGDSAGAAKAQRLAERWLDYYTARVGSSDATECPVPFRDAAAQVVAGCEVGG